MRILSKRRRTNLLMELCPLSPLQSWFCWVQSQPEITGEKKG